MREDWLTCQPDWEEENLLSPVWSGSPLAGAWDVSWPGRLMGSGGSRRPAELDDLRGFLPHWVWRA